MRVWTLLLLAGCDQILGLGKVGPPVDAAIDAPGPIRPVNGRISQLFVHADASGNPKLENVGYPPNAITLAYVNDAGSTNLDTDSDGNFMFMAPAGTYRLAVTGQGDPVVREFVVSADNVNIQAAALTRPDAVPTTGVTVHANFTMLNPVLFSTGIWETQVPLYATNVDMYAGDWPHSRLVANEGDRIYAIDYEDPPSSPATTSNYINAIAPGSVTMIDNQVADVAGPIVHYDVTPPGRGCIAMDPQFPAAFSRLGMVGSATEAQSHVWSVNAFPSDRIAPVPNGLQIAYDEVSLASNANIEDPFNLPLLAISSATAVRTYAGTALASNISEWHEITVPPSGCPPETFDTIEAPVATSLTLGGTELTQDDVTVNRNGRPSVDLTWEPAKPGIGWEIELAEVGKQPYPILVHAIVTDQTHLKIPSSLLVPTHAYVFTITSLAGLPQAASGDFETATFPFATTSVVSHAFYVL